MVQQLQRWQRVWLDAQKHCVLSALRSNSYASSKKGTLRYMSPAIQAARSQRRHGHNRHLPKQSQQHLLLLRVGPLVTIRIPRLQRILQSAGHRALAAAHRA